jgi:hypothetical protein
VQQAPRGKAWKVLAPGAEADERVAAFFRRDQAGRGLKRQPSEASSPAVSEHIEPKVPTQPFNRSILTA